MAKLTIRVFLSPHPLDRHAEAWREGWPTPSGVVLVVDGRGGHNGTRLEATDADGRTEWEDFKPGDHAIAVEGQPVPGFSRPLVVCGLTYERTLHIASVEDRSVDILLAPEDGRRLFELRTLHGDGTPVSGVTVEVAGEEFTSRADGAVYAACPDELVLVRPRPDSRSGAVPSDGHFVVDRRTLRTDMSTVYYEAGPARIRVTPTVGVDSVTGIVFELARADGLARPAVRLATDAHTTECVFEDVPVGRVTLAVVDTTRATFGAGSRVTVVPGQERIDAEVRAGDDIDLSAFFVFRELAAPAGTVSGRVLDRLGTPLPGVEIAAGDGAVEATDVTDTFGRYVIDQLPFRKWTVGLLRSPVDVGGRRLTADPPAEHTVDVVDASLTEVPDLVLAEEEHGIRGIVRDQDGQPLAFTTVEIRDSDGEVLATRQTDARGFYEWPAPAPGRFLVNVLSEDGEPVRRFPVDVNSIGDGSIVFARKPQGAGPPPAGTPADQNLVDLATFPVLTESIGGAGRTAVQQGGDRSSGYAQSVEGALRDVLGWRPGSNTSGFQAALTGAFELREVQGHTEFTWHPRGYAVQADLGALTGAQASIHQRARNALEQITPLLDGLTPLDPAADVQDAEAIRVIIRTELGELVDELAVEGGPRIQRVDELFNLLLGDRRSGTRPDPDAVGGQFAQLRDRFGLSGARIGTLDEERIVTNFRIVVDHVLALAAGWDTDRDLFSGTTDRTALGTVLIRLSRSLDVVAQSVEELVFALESVFVDAAQRQTIRLDFGGAAPSILLSDLLDWVVRVSTAEGPRLIQDAGKDGVIALRPVLVNLTNLVRGTQRLADPNQRGNDPNLPGGLRTPRVLRALRELSGQLDDTARLAGAVRRTETPVIVFVDRVIDDPVIVTLAGRGFAADAEAVLVADGRPEFGEVESTRVTLQGGRAHFEFPDLPAGSPTGSVDWLITVVNPGGIRSNTVEALRT
ncbi:carboxypeptidase regulatory-like domain-containing protein [Streptomyces sp. NPDC001536]|uniref:carboxypeptidase regulatory-like domain-containing protein n=1 Tax=Streptomyces sp. NPDC001536 TaxID=3364583 RepID=UPI0036C63CA6